MPEAEKSSVRQAVLQLLLSDSSDRVALQLGLLSSNICAFDFPSRWVCGCVETWREGTAIKACRTGKLAACCVLAWFMGQGGCLRCGRCSVSCSCAAEPPYTHYVCLCFCYLSCWQVA